ncbi:hypothetical protein LEMLEM_LOCUS4651, partial [Lemmus lemmus]
MPKTAAFLLPLTCSQSPEALTPAHPLNLCQVSEYVCTPGRVTMRRNLSWLLLVEEHNYSATIILVSLHSG